MSLITFENELLFGTGSETDGISGIAGTGTSKVLYTPNTLKDSNTTVVTTSAILNGVEYELDIFARYDGQTIAVMDVDRISTQFVFTSAASSAFQTNSATGFISVSPTARRLYQLGYI